MLAHDLWYLFFSSGLSVQRLDLATLELQLEKLRPAKSKMVRFARGFCREAREVRFELVVCILGEEMWQRTEKP